MVEVIDCFGNKVCLTEQRLVEGNRQLIERMEQEIAATLARIWGEENKVGTS